jgi:two-component system LytT family response regulator
MKTRAILVDDEPLARKRLRRLLEAHPGIEIVGEAGDGPSALELIASAAPELIFLDVQMPGMTGFDVLARLRERPRVIFVTAYDEFAVRAFDEQALDYLLKPVEPARLARAIARLEGAGAPAAETGARLDRLLQAMARVTAAPTRLAARQGARVSLIEPSSIIFCRAEDKYTVLYTAAGEHVVDRTIEDLARTLDPAVFLRIHRSTLVNLDFVKELTAVEGGRFLVTLKDARGTKLHASRAGARLLRDRFDL